MTSYRLINIYFFKSISNSWDITAQWEIYESRHWKPNNRNYFLSSAIWRQKLTDMFAHCLPFCLLWKITHSPWLRVKCAASWVGHTCKEHPDCEVCVCLLGKAYPKDISVRYYFPTTLWTSLSLNLFSYRSFNVSIRVKFGLSLVEKSSLEKVLLLKSNIFWTIYIWQQGKLKLK